MAEDSLFTRLLLLLQALAADQGSTWLRDRQVTATDPLLHVDMDLKHTPNQQVSRL